MAYDSVSAINLVFAAAICAIGLVDYLKLRSKPALFISVAFFFFWVTHMISFFGVTGLDLPVLALRILGYASVISALFVIWSSGGKTAQAAEKKAKRR